MKRLVLPVALNQHGNKQMHSGAAGLQSWEHELEYLHLSEQERQSKGLRGQVAESGLCWAGETGHTHSSDVKHRLSSFKRPT